EAVKPAEHGCERCCAAERADRRGPMTPAKRRDQKRQRRHVKQHDRQQRAGHHRSEQQSCRGARSNTDESDLHHLELSRSVERLETDYSAPTIGPRAIPKASLSVATE